MFHLLTSQMQQKRLGSNETKITKKTKRYKEKKEGGDVKTEGLDMNGKFYSD